MTIEQQYNELEKAFVQYADLAKILKCNAQTDEEKFVETFGKYMPNFNEMQSLTPNPVVRETVHKKLSAVKNIVEQTNPKWQLLVTDGFRDLAIQTRKFNAQVERFMEMYNDIERAKMEANKYVASPDVAGHPTGGAVDVVIYDTVANRILDYGTEIYDFSTKKLFVFSPEIGEDSEAYKNRMFVRGLMMAQGFAPFDGEWWHFSYGDKEWTAYYGKEECLYKQKQLNEVRGLMTGCTYPQEVMRTP